MADYTNEINYDKLVEKSLLNVMIDSLKIAASTGLPGEHHFYITFKTDHPKNILPKSLIEQYPNEMTIVVQHQFFGLTVGKDCFSIGLSFGGIPHSLTVAYDAVVYFADPHAKFGLSFNSSEDEALPEDNLLDSIGSLEEPKKASGGLATVVSIDKFRKK